MRKQLRRKCPSLSFPKFDPKDSMGLITAAQEKDQSPESSQSKLPSDLSSDGSIQIERKAKRRLYTEHYTSKYKNSSKIHNGTRTAKFISSSKRESTSNYCFDGLSKISPIQDFSSSGSIQLERRSRRKRICKKQNLNKHNLERSKKPSRLGTPKLISNSTMCKSMSNGCLDGFLEISPITITSKDPDRYFQLHDKKSGEKKDFKGIDHCCFLTSSPHHRHANVSSDQKVSRIEKEQLGLFNLELSAINSMVDSSFVNKHLLLMTRGTVNSDEIVPQSSTDKTNYENGSEVHKSGKDSRSKVEPSHMIQQTSSTKLKNEVRSAGGLNRSSQIRVCDRKSNALCSSTVATSVKSVQVEKRRSSHYRDKHESSCSLDQIELDPLLNNDNARKRKKKLPSVLRNKKFKIYLKERGSSDDEVPEDSMTKP